MITQLIGQLTRPTDSYGRTDGRTDERSTPTSDESPTFVTRAKGSNE